MLAGHGSVILGIACIGLLTVVEAHAEDSTRCRFLCPPEFKVEPTISLEPLFRRPVIEKLDGGQVVSRTTQELEWDLELVLAMGIPTTIQRLGFTVEVILRPFENVDNEPEVELEFNFYIVESEKTGGWIESHFDIVDKFSPSERPGEEKAYTHKLNFEWDTALRPFNRLPEDRYLRQVELEASIDFVATGLPRAGEVVDDVRYVNDASPWSLSFVLVFPVAPLP